MTGYVDLYVLSENDRIRAIGSLASTGQRIGVLLEDEQLCPGKITRYIKKITERYPTVSVLARGKGPVPDVELLEFGVRKETDG